MFTRFGSSINWPIVLMLLVMISSIYISLTGNDQESKHKQEIAEQKRHAEEERRAQLLAKLRSEFNADDTWSKSVVVLTADLQERLILKDGRPIIGIGRLYDVERHGDSFLLRFVKGIVDLPSPPIEFVLSCTLPIETFTPIKKVTPKEWYELEITQIELPEYAFVAKIEQVRRHDSTDSPRWIADGRCLAIREVGQEEKSKG